MVTLFNQIAECAVTGFFVALLLLFFGKMGWLPIMVVTYEEPHPDDESFG
ncbi:MAG: hypothetical protein ACRC6V_12295 [Bacteroidales bacterium]